MKVTIDGSELEVDEPLTIYLAAKRLGIEIPTMCYMEGYEPFTSCMICTVKDMGSGKKVPACSARVADGMVIETQHEDVRSFRRSTLDLLLSDHVGDCTAPCERGCGVHMEIPRMIREIAAEDLEGAIATVRRDMAIPSILERFCHAPCETPCRRGKHDQPLAIQELTRYAADWDLRRDEPFVPERAPDTGKKVAIVGAGPTGLSTAYFLALKGHACVVYESEDRVLDRLHGTADPGALPDWVVEGEVRVLRSLGIEIQLESRVVEQVAFDALCAESDAVVLACGQREPDELSALGLDVGKKGLVVHGTTAQTSRPSVFAAGNLVRADERVLKSMAAARAVTECVDQFLRGTPIVGPVQMYDHTMGKLIDGEIETFVSGASPIPRVEPGDLVCDGYEKADAELEATRCMHCDCREKDNCKLRTYSDDYGSNQRHFKGEQRATYEHVNQDAGAVYESGKCVKCGLCVHVTRQEGESLGFSFVGRGFHLKAGVSLGKSLPEGLQKVADEVIEACPTGALAKNEKLDAVRPTGADVTDSPE